MSDPSEQPRRRRRETAAPPPAQGSIARGIVLVVIAVAIGAILLRNDDGVTTQVAVGAATNSADGGGGDDSSSTSSTTSTTVAARPASQVKVLVANGSSVNGAAGATTTELEALGYVTATPTNADRVPATIVYYTVGFEAEARELAAAIGAAPTAVAQMPAVAPVDDLQLSNILVVIGPDLASSG